MRQVRVVYLAHRAVPWMGRPRVRVRRVRWGWAWASEGGKIRGTEEIQGRCSQHGCRRRRRRRWRTGALGAGLGVGVAAVRAASEH